MFYLPVKLQLRQENRLLVQFSILFSRISLLTIWIPGKSRDIVTQEALLTIHSRRGGISMQLRQRCCRRHRGHGGVASNSPLSLVPLLHFAAQSFVVLASINDE